MIEKLMTNIVKEKMPISASFFRSSIDAFQRRFVESRITVALSDSFFHKRCTMGPYLLRPSVVVSSTVAIRR